MKTAGIVACLLCLGIGANGEFTLEDDQKTLTVLENGAPVFAYNYAPVPVPASVPATYVRSCYVHPLYGLDGQVVTQDFPKDHYHHRGLFWAWPECTVGGRRMDVWLAQDVKQRHRQWVARDAGPDKAEIAVVNGWSFEDAPEKDVVREEVKLTALPADEKGRAIDFEINLTNVSDQLVVFEGAKNKGYGGLCFRPHADFKPFTFTTALGVSPKDALRCETPWADVSWTAGEKTSGLAIFQHASNPGYPFPGWIFRHYAFLGVSWPHEQTHELPPGQSFRLKYRVYVHRGNAAEATVAAAFEKYASSQ
ncbi:MAG TPA: PmoA family protein [Candidatus Bathyarchaeia archaeon]|nr:PmoA family protein [Candidatus Bathyarchaeia archaeon]